MNTIPVPTTPGLASQLFRNEHLEIRAYLEQIGHMVEALHGGARPDWRDVSDWQDVMRMIVRLLNDHIRTHADWEEEALYPVVDRFAQSGAHRFTATMRFEHKIIARQIDELAGEAAKASPDIRKFARHADNLLGLVAAHFEEEEEVLLAILDSEMTADEFKREVMDRGGAGHCGHRHRA